MEPRRAFAFAFPTAAADHATGERPGQISISRADAPRVPEIHPIRMPSDRTSRPATRQTEPPADHGGIADPVIATGGVDSKE
ncbi:hypothetical protein AB7M35_002132 [Amorphus suaedae]